MNITILTTGSRGDVQPFVALGTGLKRAGYEVTVCTHEHFASFIRERGLQYAFMNDELIRLAETEEGRAALESGGNPLGLLKKVMPAVRKMLDESWAAAQGAQAIVYHPKALAGSHISEKLKIPGFLGVPVPLYTPTSAFPLPLLPDWKLGGWLNKLSYKILPLLSAPYMAAVNEWRERVLKLPRRSFGASERVLLFGEPLPILYCYSRHAVPIPEDWRDTAAVTGYWFLDREENWQPPAKLCEFLATGEAPVYVGFGSMAGRNPERLTEIVLEALAKSRQRGVLATGWGGLAASPLPDTVFQVGSVPHDWLFPLCRAVVHHGGAGTTAAGLRAGKPAVICPFFGDQPFWGGRLFQLGVAPAPLPQNKLTADKLAAAIRLAVSSEDMCRRAAAIGEKIGAENGVARAVELIGSRLS